MNGIQRAKRFYKKLVRPLLEDSLKESFNTISVAFLGEGSEILGYDDLISEDHNAAPKLKVFLQTDEPAVKSLSAFVLGNLPSSFEHFPLRRDEPSASVSFDTIERYLKDYLSILKVPPNPTEWIAIEEQKLLEITSATILHDPRWALRSILKTIDKYPKEIRLFLMHRSLCRLSEVGGIERCIRRKDLFATKMYFMNYAYYAIRLLHLLHRVYCPYQKWMMRSLSSIGGDCSEVERLLSGSFCTDQIDLYRDLVLDIYEVIKDRMSEEGLYSDSFDEKAANLVLLNLPGIDATMAKISALLPDYLTEIPTYVQPPSLWGNIFDYSGYGVSFKELLRQNLGIAENGT